MGADGTGRTMSRWTLRAGVLLVAGGLLFAWVPDIELGDRWVGRAVSAPEARPHAAAEDETACSRRAIDTTTDPSTDITSFRAARSHTGLVLVATFHDLLPRVQQDVEFDVRTSHGREVNVGVSRTPDTGVSVTIGDAPDPVQAAADAEQCSAAATIVGLDDCTGLTGRMDDRADRVVVRVPRDCLGDPRWVRAGVSSVRHVSPSRMPRDVWLPPGGNRRADFGPLGPWVSLVP